MARICRREDVMFVRWLHSKYGNFTKGKIYKAKSYSRLVKDAGEGVHTGFRIMDDEGDLFNLHKEDIGRNIMIIGSELDDCH